MDPFVRGRGTAQEAFKEKEGRPECRGLVGNELGVFRAEDPDVLKV